MLISRGTAPEKPAHTPKMTKGIFTNFKKENHEFTNYGSNLLLRTIRSIMKRAAGRYVPSLQLSPT